MLERLNRSFINFLASISAETLVVIILIFIGVSIVVGVCVESYKERKEKILLSKISFEELANYKFKRKDIWIAEIKERVDKMSEKELVSKLKLKQHKASKALINKKLDDIYYDNIVCFDNDRLEDLYANEEDQNKKNIILETYISNNSDDLESASKVLLEKILDSSSKGSLEFVTANMELKLREDRELRMKAEELRASSSSSSTNSLLLAALLLKD